MDLNDLLVHECDVVVPCALDGVLNKYVVCVANNSITLLITSKMLLAHESSTMMFYPIIIISTYNIINCF